MEEKGWEEEGKEEEEKEEEREFEEEEEKAGEGSPSSRVQAGGETTGRTASGFFPKPDKQNLDKPDKQSFPNPDKQNLDKPDKQNLDKEAKPVSVEMMMISSDTLYSSQRTTKQNWSREQESDDDNIKKLKKVHMFT